MNRLELNSKTEPALMLVRGEQQSVSWWEPRDLLETGFRYRRLIAASAGLILLLSMLAALVLPRQYESEAKILVKHEFVDPVVSPGANQQQIAAAGVTPEELNSEVELIRSDDLLRDVVRTCGLARTGQNPGEQERNLAVAVVRLRSKLNVDMIYKTNILAIHYAGTSPEQAKQVVNTVVSLYLEKHVAAHRVPGELAFFDQQVDHYKEELANAQAALATFAHIQGGVAPATQRDALLQRQNEFNATLQQTNSAISETREKLRNLEKQAATTPARVTTQLRRADNPQLLQDLQSTLLRLQLKRTELLAKYQPTYRPVQEVESEIARTQAAISAAEAAPMTDQTTDVNPTHLWIDSELAKTRAELRSLESRATNMAPIIANYNQQAEMMQEQDLKYQDLVRNAKTAESNLLLYEGKREEARITAALDQGRILNVSVIEPATRPYLPKRSGMFYIFAGLLAAMAASAGLVLFLHRSGTTFRTPGEIEYFVQVPVLAVIPMEPQLPAHSN